MKDGISHVNPQAAKVLEEYGSDAAMVLEEIDPAAVVPALNAALKDTDEVEHDEAALKDHENLRRRAEAILELSDALEDTDVCRWVGDQTVDVSEYAEDELGEFRCMTSTENIPDKRFASSKLNELARKVIQAHSTEQQELKKDPRSEGFLEANPHFSPDFIKALKDAVE